MELGTYQLQVFISLVVILAAAGVALICDFLKGNNEQLRELTIELKVRREEEQRRIQLLMPQLAAAGMAGAPVARAIQSEDARATKTDDRPRRPWPGSNAAVQSTEAPQERKRTASPEAVAVMERGAQLAGARRKPVDALPPETSIVVVEAPAASAPRANWGALLDSSRESKTVTAETHVNESLLEAVMAVTNSSSQAKTGHAVLPAGFQEDYVLKQLVESRQPISGLVVSIGVGSREQDGSGRAQAVALVRSLLGPEDFAAQPGENEFLLIFPTEHGASAQRRLSRISEQLWDFQLRSLGTCSILFSWGGVEVRGESIDEAIASASERMRETQRGRKVLSMVARNPESALRRAV